VLPPHLAGLLTTGELAMLRIIANEAQGHGGCRLHINAIAARAGGQTHYGAERHQSRSPGRAAESRGTRAVVCRA
jgi:hypothetical protein